MGKFQRKAWNDIFKVNADTTEKDLKSQYAKLIKEFKPNESPEEFNEIRDAYKIAKNYLQNGDYRDEIIKKKEYVDKTDNQVKDTSDENELNTVVDKTIMSENQSLVSENKLSVKVDSSNFYKMIVEDLAYHRELNVKTINKFFYESKNLYDEIFNFYYVTKGLLSQETILELFDGDTKNIWKAFFASSAIKEKSKDLSVFTEIEKKYLMMGDTPEKLELFIEIVNTTGFSYPFNYMTRFVFDMVQINRPDILSKYMDSVDPKFLFYYHEPRSNAKTFKMMSDDRKVEYFIYLLASIDRTAYNLVKHKKIYSKVLKVFGEQKLESLNQPSFKLDVVQTLAQANYEYLLKCSVSHTENYIYALKYKAFVKSDYLRNEKTKTSKFIFAGIIIAVIAFLIFSNYSTDNEMDEDTQNSINNLRGYVTDNQTQDFSVGDICMNFDDVDFDMDVIESVEEDGVNTVSVSVVGNGFDVNNLYIGDVNLSGISNDITVEEVEEGLLVKFSYNVDNADAYTLSYVVGEGTQIVCGL